MIVLRCLRWLEHITYVRLLSTILCPFSPARKIWKKRRDSQADLAQIYEESFVFEVVWCFVPSWLRPKR